MLKHYHFICHPAFLSVINHSSADKLQSVVEIHAIILVAAIAATTVATAAVAAVASATIEAVAVAAGVAKGVD